MTTLGTGAGNLRDVTSTFGADGKPLMVAEVLAQQNGMFDDIPWVEGTDSDGYQCSLRTGLPTVSRLRYNVGISPTKGATASTKFMTGGFGTVSEVDLRLANKHGNPDAYRAKEDKAHIEALGQAFATDLIYGSEATNPDGFTGLQSYLSALSGVESSDYVINGGGSGSDNTSIYVINWGTRGVFGIYPKHSEAGLKVKNMGAILVQDALGVNGATYEALQTRFTWECGLAVPDYRHVVRICNLDHSALVTNSSAADLPKLITRAMDIIEAVDGNCGIYMRRDVMGVFNEQCLARVSTGGGINYENVDGKRVGMWRGVKVRRMDALTKTEATVA